MKWKRHFTLVELMCALALTVLLFGMFFSLMQQLKRSRTAVRNEFVAVLVLENTLERLRPLEHPTRADAKRIFAEEFRAAELPPKFSLETRTDEAGMRLGIRGGPEGPWIAEMTLPWRN